MKNCRLIIALGLAAFACTANAQTAPIINGHGFSLGPVLGYDYKLKAPTYGAGLMYEYRPFRNVGFTAGIQYELSRKELNKSDIPESQDGVIKHQVYSASLGARYYMNSFYLAGALGMAHERGSSEMKDGSKLDGGNVNSLYHSLGLGYQMPLNNGDRMEFELGSFGTKNSMKVGGTIRYKLMR